MELYNVPNHQALSIIELAKQIERGRGVQGEEGYRGRRSEGEI